MHTDCGDVFILYYDIANGKQNGFGVLDPEEFKLYENNISLSTYCAMCRKPHKEIKKRSVLQ